MPNPLHEIMTILRVSTPEEAVTRVRQFQAGEDYEAARERRGTPIRNCTYCRETVRQVARVREAES